LKRFSVFFYILVFNIFHRVVLLMMNMLFFVLFCYTYLIVLISLSIFIVIIYLFVSKSYFVLKWDKQKSHAGNNFLEVFFCLNNYEKNSKKSKYYFRLLNYLLIFININIFIIIIFIVIELNLLKCEQRNYSWFVSFQA